MITLTPVIVTLPEGYKKCPRCKTIKSFDKFGKRKNYCKICWKSYTKEFRKNLSKEKLQWYRRTEDTKGQEKRRAEKSFKLKQEMILAYGGICSCCGESDIHFLTLEHLDGGGNEHRRKFNRASRTWQDLKEKGWPEGYTILCWNCQMGKTHYGICPHQTILKELMEVA